MKYGLIALLGAALISTIGNFAFFTATHEYHVFDMTKAQPIMSLMMLNHLVYAGMMVYLYPRFNKVGESHQRRGMWFGLCMGIVMFVPTGLVVRSAWEVPMTVFFPIDIVFLTLLSGLMGLFIAWAHTKFSHRVGRA